MPDWPLIGFGSPALGSPAFIPPLGDGLSALGSIPPAIGLGFGSPMPAIGMPAPFGLLSVLCSGVSGLASGDESPGLASGLASDLSSLPFCPALGLLLFSLPPRRLAMSCVSL